MEHLSDANFLVRGTDVVISIKCSYGGEPLAYWGNKIDEEVDSLLNIKTLYVKEGFEASDIIISSKIKNNIQGSDGVHIKV